MVSAQLRLALQAMRYYRLWIYAANLVLMAGVVLFVSVAFALLSDPRRQLLPPSAISPHQPSVLYAYAALLVQGAVLPVVGCLGALRLSERLLNSYWLMLLVLLAGDIVVGLVWIFRFQKIVNSLVPELKHRLSTDYGTGQSADFDAAWDLLQRSARCCGVESPQDFNNSQWLANLADRPAWQPSLFVSRVVQLSSPSPILPSSSSSRARLLTGTDGRVSRLPLPDSCCKSNSLSNSGGIVTDTHIPPGRKEVYGTGKHRQQLRDYNERYHERMMREQLILQQQQQQLDNRTLGRYPRRARRPKVSNSSPRPTATTSPNAQDQHHQTVIDTVSDDDDDELADDEINSQEEDEDECGRVWPSLSDPTDVHEAGCAEFVLSWLHRTGDTLFVLGYCVLAFVKLCFLAILRYELREMVQKIKILQSEQAAILNTSGAALGGPMSILAQQQHNSSSMLAVNSLHHQRISAPPLVATEAATESESTDHRSPERVHLMAAQQLNGEVPTGTGKQHKRKSSSLSYSEYIQFQQPDEELFPSSPPDTPIRRLISSSQTQQQHQHDTGADSDSGSHCALLPSSSSAAASATASPAGHQSSQHQRRLIKDWEQAGVNANTAASAGGVGVGSSGSASWIQPAVQQLQADPQQQQQHNNGWPGRSNGNNNEYHELREIKQTQI